ncbi:hypothetical protein GCM10023339_71250 [Alloalcanivorax gelatiniphagus]
MTNQPDESRSDRPDDTPDDDAAPGAEIGMTDGEGSTFEPEEDPEGHDG